MAKNKKTKKQKSKERQRKAKKWILSYEGKDVVQAYGKRFKVDPICAARELEAINALTKEQRSNLKQQHKMRLLQKKDEHEAKLRRELEERLEIERNNRGLEHEISDTTSGTALEPRTDNVNTKNGKRPKRRCANCGRAMKQQFIGLKHCKCGTSWSKAVGYFERTSDMVFALQRNVTKKGKNSVRTKQVPVIRYKQNESLN